MKFEVSSNHELIKIIFEASDFGGEYNLNQVINIKIPEKVDGEYIWHIGRVGKKDNSLIYSYPPDYTVNPIIKAKYNQFNIDTLEIPDGVNTIGADAFTFCNINKIILPDSLTEINNGAFSRCHIFSDLVLPPALEKIGESAFQRTMFHGTITCPASLKHIGAGAFQQTNLKKIIFNEKTKTLSMKQRAFCESTIEEISFPKNLASLGEHAFYSCFNLKKVTFAPKSNKIKIIPKYCFHGCSALTTVENIPKSVIKISERAFSNTALRDFDFASSRIKTIERCSFDHSGLTTFIAPATLLVVGSDAFSSCRNLKTVKIPYPKPSTYAHSVFAYCSALESVEFDDPMSSFDVACITSRMFASCTSLKNVVWPKNLYVIGEASFVRTAIKELDISEAHRFLTIRVNAFSECSISKIKFNPFTTSYQIKIFDGVNGIDTELLEKAKEDLIF